ncbi:MAG TPA: FtsX-like permease family protein [Microthrixaceae bacterium]|nr:FtsX-like permease family protein [Microthrixaceae bacterium]
MFQVALKDLMARKRRLVTTGLAVVLGIAFLTGTRVLSTVLEDSIDSLISDVYEGMDAVVRSPEVQDLGFGQEVRAPVAASAVERVAEVDGVRVARGVVEAPSVQLIGSDGKVVGSNFGPPTLVYNWLDDERLQPGVLTEGREPRTEDEVALDFATAESGGYEVGDTVTVSAPEGPETFELVGLMGLGEDGSRSSGARVLVFVTPVAQRLAQMPDQFNFIAAAAEDGVGDDELAERLGEALPQLQTVTGTAFTEESSEAIAQFVNVLSTFVSVFGYIALFVAAFIIYNTFSILVAQRTRETALLRAIGAGRRQVLVATILEAALVGLIASLLGLALGVVLATGLKAAVGRLFTVEPGVPSLPAAAIVTALVVGVGVTVLSAVVPAWRSSKVPPVAAMSEVSIDRSRVSRARLVWGTIFLVVGIALFTLGVTDTGPNPLAEFGAGAALVLIAVAVVLGPLIASPVSRFLARPFGRRGRVTSRLAGENAARNPKRTAATAAALTIGVTLVTLIAVVANSVKTSVDAAVNERFDADFVVAADVTSFSVGVPKGAEEQIRELPNVELTSAVRFSFFRLLDEFGKQKAAERPAEEPTNLPAGAPDEAPEGQDDFALGIDPATFFEVIDSGELTGSPEDMGPDTIATRAAVAEERGWEIGDRIPVYFAATGEQELELVLTFEEDAGQGSYLVPAETLQRNGLPFFDFDVAVYIQADDRATDAELAELRSQLEDIVAGSPSVQVQDLEEYAEAQTGPLDTILAVIYGLLGLAVVIALIGIANTLTLSVLERTRELGLLRAVGMSRRQLRRTIMGESTIIAVFGTLMGLVIGIVFSIALSVVIAAEDPGLFRYALPYGQLVVITVVAAIAGVLAAVLPARRAAKLDVLDAIASV